MKAGLVIFDLDGTLLDTIADLGVSCNHALKTFGFPEHSEGEYRMMVGGGIRRLVTRALPEAARTESTVDEVLKEFITYYSAHLYDFTEPYEGIAELLTVLKDRLDLSLAVASNKFDYATRILISHFFPGVFSVVYGNMDGVPLKPDAEVVSRIMSACGASKSGTFMVGDSGIDIVTAINAGIQPIGVEWGFRSREELENAGAGTIVSSPREIADVISLKL